MDFKQAKKEFELLKNAWVTGAISLDELREAIDTRLEVIDRDGSTWKIDEDTGLWLKFDNTRQCWSEGDPQVNEPEKAENLAVKISPASVSTVPADDYRAWQECCKNNKEKNTGENQVQTASKNFCTKCGNKLKPSNKFCTGCGQKVK
ncbi:MAG: zinc ribbon domain-containing protein [Candidatus Rifleibacteriota bacterium]